MQIGVRFVFSALPVRADLPFFAYKKPSPGQMPAGEGLKYI